MARQSAETRLVLKMRKAAREKYGPRLVDIKYHGDAMSEAGVSDILCSLDGIFVACEVKAPESYKVRGQPSVHKALAKGPTVKQRLFVDRVLASGGVAGFAADIEGFMVVLACAAARAHKPHEWRCDGHNLDVQWPNDERFDS